MGNNWTDYREGGMFLGALAIRDGFSVGQAYDDALEPVVTLQIKLRAADHARPVVLAFTPQQAADLKEMLEYVLN